MSEFNGDYQSALNIYRQAIQLNPNRSYCIQRAFEYSQIGKNKVAMNNLGYAWQINPSKSKAYLNMARSLIF